MFYSYRRKFWRPHDRKHKPSVRYPIERLRRVPAQIQIESTKELLDARIFLYDLKPDSVNIFLPYAIPRGETIFLVIDHPKTLYLKAKVVWCMLHTLNMRVISAESFQYRACLKFEFENTVEASSVRRFCEELSNS